MFSLEDWNSKGYFIFNFLETIENNFNSVTWFLNYLLLDYSRDKMK